MLNSIKGKHSGFISDEQFHWMVHVSFSSRIQIIAAHIYFEFPLNMCSGVLSLFCWKSVSTMSVYWEGPIILLQSFYLTVVYIFKFRISHFVVLEVHGMLQIPSLKCLVLIPWAECRYVFSIMDEDFYLIIPVSPPLRTSRSSHLVVLGTHAIFQFLL